MSSLDERLAGLSPQKRELLMRRLAARGDGPSPGPHPQPRDGRPVPLTYAQEHLWSLDRVMRGTSLFTMAEAIRLDGPLDVAALERSLAEIVRRHEILRTTFHWVAGQACQVVGPVGDFALPVIDLSSLSEAERETAAREGAIAEAHRPFSLMRGPLFRTVLLRLGREAHVAVFAMHHTVSDGWSVGVFLRELSRLYGAFRRGAAPPLPPLPIQYADYALWQRDAMDGPAAAPLLAYWQQELSGSPTRLGLPVRDTGGGTGLPSVSTQRRRLSPAFVRAMKRMAAGEGATTFMALLAGVQACLYRRTGCPDVRVGTNVANRTRRVSEPLIGLFANTVVLRSRFTEGLTARGLLNRAAEATLRALDHQELPYELLCRELEMGGDPPSPAAFEAMLLCHDTPVPLPELGEVGATRFSGMDARLPSSSAVSSCDIVVEAVEEAGSIMISVTYRSGRLDDGTARGLLQELEHVLVGMTGAPDRSVARL